MCIYIFVCVHMYVYMSACVSVCVWMCLYMHTCVYMYIYECVCIYMNVCICICTCVYVWHICTCVYAQCGNVCHHFPLYFLRQDDSPQLELSVLPRLTGQWDLRIYFSQFLISAMVSHPIQFLCRCCGNLGRSSCLHSKQFILWIISLDQYSSSFAKIKKYMCLCMHTYVCV